jgi:hypothetical protein
MSDNKNIDQLVNDALGSIDDAERASAKPFLFTRIQAAMLRQPETYWEKTGRLIARPAVVIAGLCLVLVINLAAVINSNNKPDLQEEITVNTDDYSNTVAVVYDIDNNEP